MEIRINCDGGSRGNPGPSACGFVVYEGGPSTREARSGLPALKMRAKCGKYLGVGTNNEAEYAAVIEAWKWLRENGERILRQFASQAVQDDSTLCCRFYLDSKLVVNQINGNFKVREPRLMELLKKVKEGERKNQIVATYEYVPREKNSEADLKVNQTLDEALQ